MVTRRNKPTADRQEHLLPGQALTKEGLTARRISDAHEHAPRLLTGLHFSYSMSHSKARQLWSRPHRPCP